VTQLDDLVLIVLDVDGVLTDGRVMLGAGDEELKAFSTRDGAGLALWRDAGYRCTFLTGRGGAAVRRRASELRVERIWENVRDKSAAYDEMLEHFKVEPHQVAVMGDDLPDLSMLKRAGFSTCPSDAAQDVLERVDWVAPSPGGHGAVRDLVEHILRARGTWGEWVEALT